MPPLEKLMANGADLDASGKAEGEQVVPAGEKASIVEGGQHSDLPPENWTEMCLRILLR